MTELEKLKAAKEVLESWRSDIPKNGPNLATYLANEIDRLEDPHAEAKRRIAQAERRGSAKEVRAYIRYLESELAKTIEAAEPLDPKRVLATAAKVCDGSINFHSGTDQRVISETARRLIWLCGINAEPYEVKE